MKKIILLTTLVVTIFSCKNNDFELPTEYHNADRKSSEFKMIEMQMSFTDSVQEFQAEFVDSLVIIEGDIIIGRTEDFSENRLAVITGNGKLWTEGKIPYTIQSNHPRRNLILQAINEVNSKTNLKLTPRTSQSDYVNFVTSSGCSSWIGKQRGKQNINIGPCSFGSIIHEILHASGFYHEQSRKDRDNYISILWNNIHSGKEHNFKRYVDRGYPGMDIGNYDYGSIMHYGHYGFSKNGQKTIDIKIPPANSSTTIGQRNGLSSNDITSVNLAYPNRFSSSDNIRGWSWNGTTASYIAEKNGKNVLYIRSFDGVNYGQFRELPFSSSDNVRSWSWDGTTASYHAEKNGKTVLYIRPFDGTNFGDFRELPFSSSDNVRSWSWDGTTASYHAEKNGKTVLYSRTFDGINFGEFEELFFSSSDNVRSWSWDGTTASYHAEKNGKTVIYIRPW